MLTRAVPWLLAGLLALPARAEEPDTPAPAADPAAGDSPAPAPAHKVRKKRGRAGARKGRAHVGRIGSWALDLEARAASEAGYLKGSGIRPDGAAVTALRTAVTPALEKGRWRVQLPVSFAHRQTFGASLSETEGGLYAELRWRRDPRLRLEGEAGVDGVWRPDWPDLYQPLAAGGYAPTDRYSHWDRRVGASIAGIPLRHQHARARWRYTLADYATDPTFDPVGAPTHLAPFDHQRHELDLSWRYLGDGWKLGGAADLFWRKDDFLFARDRGTGRTHAGAGGPPPNPLQVRVGVEPQVEGAIELAGGRGELSAGYGLEVVDDVFEGYYSYTGHHPSVELAWHAGRWRTALGLDVRLRRYGPGSYAEGPDHPPLAYGDRRLERRFAGKLTGELALHRHLYLTLEARATVRRTNFPPYVPGVFPDTREYDIDWSYENYLVVAGIEARL